MRVGTKKLKNQLSHYLREVRRGRRVYVTDRGQVIAEIRSVARRQGRTAKRIQELAARGDVVLGAGRVEDVEPVVLRRRGARLSSAVIDDRG